MSTKFQRQDGVLLQVQEGANSVASVNQPHQVVDHTATQVHQSPFGVRDNSYIHDGAMNTPRISTTIGSEIYANGGQGLTSTSFAPPDFKQEKSVIVSCEEPTHSNNGPGTLTNGLNQVPGSCSKFNLPAGQEYIQQELEYFDHVIQARFNEDSAPAPPQTVQHQGNASIAACDDDRGGQVPETQLGGHHPKSHQLKEFARKSQLAQAQQVVPYIDNQDHANHQFPRQPTTQYALGQQSPGLQHPYSTGKYPGAMPMISTDQQQMLQEPNHPVASIASGFPRQFESLQYQRGPASQSQQQQQQTFYGFSQNSLPSSKLSHLPSQVQQLYSQRFQSQPVMPTSQGAGLVRPLASHDLARYSMPRSQAQYQRQSSMPPLQGQTFLNSDSQYQQQVPGFQGDQSGFSNPVADLTTAYHYQRRNSFPIYRNNNQPPGTLSHGMRQNLGSSQASLLRGVLQNPSQSIPPERDSFLGNPNLGMPSSTPMQTSPLLTGRPPSANADLNPGVPRSQHSSVAYRSNASQQSGSVLQQGGKFQASSNVRKVPPESSFSVLTPTSAPLRDINERQSSTAGTDAQFSAYSPLNALDKAPSFTSLLEQSAINQGNLETTYTGSIPNLDLLGEILGQ